MKTKALTSLLGITFDGNRMTAVVLRRNGRRFQAQKTLQATLSLDLLTNDSELVGREIRNHLAEAGIRESRCLVCVPLKWVLTHRSELPELSEEDTQEYLNVQAERNFPFGPEDLSIAVTRIQTASGRNEAMIAAIPKNHLNALLGAFKAAKLHAIGLTLSITALCRSESSREGCALLVPGQAGIDLAVACGGDVVAMRSFEAQSDDGEGQADLDAERVARQIRITLGQLPEDIRNTVRTIHVFGSAGSADEMVDLLGPHASSLGLVVRPGTLNLNLLASGAGSIERLPAGLIAATAERLTGRPSLFEFLPPRTSRFKMLTGRVSSRATRWLVAATAVVVLGLVAAFVAQHVRLSRLEAQWKQIAPKYNELSAVQDKIRQFRGWFDLSPRHLVIARSLTRAFPEDGVVWAESIEIVEIQDSDMPLVKCTGKARSDREWQRMRERLHDTKGVSNLRVNSVSGENPFEFTFSFNWNEGEADGV